MLQLIHFIGNLAPFQHWLPDLDLGERSELSGTTKGLWIDPSVLLELINAQIVAEWALGVTYRWHPDRQPTTGPGRRYTYQDTVVLLTMIVMRLWRKGYESFTGWLARHPSLAQSLGYTAYDKSGNLATISSSQLSRRARHLGLLPFLLFFVALVWQLIRLGVIKGRDLIIDSSCLKAWYHADPDADWRYPDSQYWSIFGYKIHTLVCRHFVLPVFFWVTPANAADGPWAIPLLIAAVVLYGFQVWLVRADGAYFSWGILGFIHDILGASPLVDYNVRRKNRQLVTLGFTTEWEGLMGPRSDIERHFAWAKRYFGLKYFQCWTFLRVSQYVLLTYCVILGVALAAQRYGRPELRHRRAEVLARSLP
jgi:hypothetical protein